MSITKTSDGWYVDCRGADKKRHRVTFQTREEARDFEFRIRYGVVSQSESSDSRRKPLHEGFKEFSQIEIPKRMDSGHSKRYLTDLYDYLTDELGLFYIDEVETIHLDRYQTLLKSGPSRVELWKKIEANRKARCKRNGEEYVPAKMHRTIKVDLTGKP